MTKQVQFRRGTTAQHSVFTGALAEITVDTDKKTAVVHDASTVGGLPLVGSYGGSYTFTTDLNLIGAASRSISLRGGNGANASLTINSSNHAQFFNNLTIGDADTDTITVNSQFVTGTQLKSAKSAGNTLALSAFDVDGASYTDLITLTAGNTPTIAITSTGVGSINNINIGASTRGTGAFTTLDANGNVTLGDASGDTVTVNGTTTFNAPVSFSGGTSHLTLTGELRGPATFIIDPSTVGDDTGTVSIKGNLEVLGTTTTINSTVTTLADPVIELRRGNSITAADGGVQVNLTTNGSGVVQTFQRLQWNNGSTRWETTDGTTAKEIVNTVDAQTLAGNKTFSNNLTASGSNAAIQFSPTGSGGVTISPTGSGGLTINPTTTGNINNTNIGATTAGTGRFTSIEVRDTTTTARDLFLASNSSVALTADRTLTFDVENADRTISLGGNIDIANNFTTTGNFALTLTTTAATTATLPTGNITLVDLSSSQALTNKTISGLTVSTTNGTLTIANGKTLTVNNTITFAGTDATTMTFPGSSGTVVTLDASQALTNKTINGLTVTSTTGTLTIASGKTLTASNSITFAGTDATTMTFPSTSGTVVTTDAAQNLTNKTCSFPTVSDSLVSKSYVDLMTIAFGC